MTSGYENIVYSSISPLLAENVNQSLAHFTKVHKVMIELTQRVAGIQFETASLMLTTVDSFSKKLTDLSKDKFQGQNESYVKFVKRVLEQVENQAKTLQNLGNSFSDCVVKPLHEVVEKKKEIWKTCFHYADSFQLQIQKKEEDLLKRHKDYSESVAKYKESAKHQKMCDNARNTYLLRLSSVNSINNLMYTHVLPHVIHTIELNQNEVNDSLRHHYKYMFSIQKEAVKKMLKSIDKIDHATAKIDLLTDLKRFTKSLKANDRVAPKQSVNIPIAEGRKLSSADASMKGAFILNECTKPNLQRRLASLQYQTSELVDSISLLQSDDENKEDIGLTRTNDPALNEVIEVLYICDKEANLNVLLKQMELYTPAVKDFLGPAPSNLMKERLHSITSPVPADDSVKGEKPHDFVLPKLMKPIACTYCKKIILFTGKGYMCKTCKICVHKKCSFNVSFCGGVLQKAVEGARKLPEGDQARCENSVVFDLIDLDDESFDDDEFDDDFSDDEEYGGHTTINGDDLLNFSQPALTPMPSTATVQANTKPPMLTKKSALPKPAIVKPKPVLAKKPSIAAKVKTFCVSLYDFAGTQENDLSFASGRRIELLNGSDDQWWEGRLDNFTGFFPCQYVIKLRDGQQVYQARYDFAPESDLELNVIDEQIVVLTNDEDEEWFKVKSANGEGLVPKSYLQRLF